MKKENLVVIFIVVIIVSFGCGAVGSYLLVKMNNSDNNSGVVFSHSEVVLDEDNSISKGVSNVYDSVVVVEGFSDNSLVSTGTGFVYKKANNKAYIMTNHHVIDGADSVKVVLSDDRVVDVEVMGSEVYSDIGVLAAPAKEINHVAVIGDTSLLNVGDTLFAVGAPGGLEYAGSVTKGILSGKDRLVSVSVAGGNQYDYYMKVLQTDAAINPGNSGGPICNINGEVIGVTNMKLVDSTIEGMGFAIPIEDALIYAEVLESGKGVERPYLGIGMCDVNDTARLYYNRIMLDENVTYGVVILEIDEKSSAAKAGLKKGDVIISLAGEKIESIANLRYELYKHTPGEEIKIKYLRNGKKKSVKIKLTTNSN